MTPRYTAASGDPEVNLLVLLANTGVAVVAFDALTRANPAPVAVALAVIAATTLCGVHRSGP